MGRGRWRARAFCRAAACRRRRRTRAGEAPARRAHPGRLTVLGAAAAACRVFARKPVLRHAGAERRDREPPSARRARRHHHRSHLGDTGRWHSLGHRAAPRQRIDRAVPRHRRHALVRPAAVGRVRGNAQAHRRARRLLHRRREQRHRQRTRDARGTAADPRARRLRHLRAAAVNGAAGADEFCGTRHLRSSPRLLRSTGGPPGHQYPGAVGSSGAARRVAAQCSTGGLSNERTAGSARPHIAGRARAAGARRHSGVPAGGRDRPASPQAPGRRRAGAGGCARPRVEPHGTTAGLRANAQTDAGGAIRIDRPER